ERGHPHLCSAFCEISAKRLNHTANRNSIEGDHLNGAQMAATFSEAIGEEVRYNYVPPEVYRTFGFPGAEDLGNMFQFFRDFSTELCAARSIEFSRGLNPGLQTFRAWLADNLARIPLEPKRATA